MNEIKIEDPESKWFSTYSIITAERVLGKFQIKLPANRLMVAIRTPFSFYHQILEVPLKNILNGIVMQQSNDYHLYVQKILIDYLLSGESSKDPETQGALTRKSIEDERELMTTLADNFLKFQKRHSTLIANSQAFLIKIAKNWNNEFEIVINKINSLLKKASLESKKSMIREGLSHALVHTDWINNDEDNKSLLFVDFLNSFLKLTLNEEIKIQVIDSLGGLITILKELRIGIEPFLHETKELFVEVKSYRSQFYESILRVIDLLKLLPEYKIDPIKDTINRETLYFDTSIGELL